MWHRCCGVSSPYQWRCSEAAGEKPSLRLPRTCYWQALTARVSCKDDLQGWVELCCYRREYEKKKKKKRKGEKSNLCCVVHISVHLFSRIAKKKKKKKKCMRSARCRYSYM
ncbi:hypothetical protein POVWA2_019190 [Plasmodium ovale wallikeri]|uniref:Uncharacterized protein n=1 Tax=Plasmodium ovale wallikeri TaxID=864142 RepID=A0A1A8YS90_PLAOA|nr:hypothetical protein POVWA2_019190 [Plasmodium ovale wallikeri]